MYIYKADGDDESLELRMILWEVLRKIVGMEDQHRAILLAIQVEMDQGKPLTDKQKDIIKRLKVKYDV